MSEKELKKKSMEIDSPRCGICTHLLYQDQLGTGLCELKKMKPKDAYSNPCNKYETDERIKSIIDDIIKCTHNERIEYEA